MKKISAKDVTDLVHQLNDLGGSFIDNLPLYNIVEVGGESFELTTNWSWGFTLITKVDEGLMEEDYFKTVTGNSTNKKLVVSVSNNTGNFYSFIYGYDGTVFDAFFYDGLIETLKKSFLLSTFHDRNVSYYHLRILEIVGRMGDKDAAEMARYAFNHLS